MDLLPVTTVVNIRNEQTYDVYIGRVFGVLGQSPFNNPFLIGADGNRAEVIEKFAEYWYAPEQAVLRRKAVEQLRGKILGCWCKPNLCHGDIIAGYVNWKMEHGQ
jgi:hypothetical protein